ncbi:hypothetical protein PS6_009510 [Mucor atramentarius]
MVQTRRSGRIEAAFKPEKAFVNTIGAAKLEVGIKYKTSTNTEEEGSTTNEDLSIGSLGFGDNLFRYQCSVCNKKMASLRSVLDHRQAIHNTTHRLPKNVDLEPDADDPNFYCKACQKHLKQESAYRSHLRKIHHMVLKDLQQKRQRNGIRPESNDTDDDYASDEVTNCSKRVYHEHPKKHHDMNLSPSEATNSHSELPVWSDPSLYCAQCNLTYKSKRTYSQHCQIIHMMGAPTKDTRTSTANSKDPKIYCTLCKRIYKNKGFLRRHHNDVHGIKHVKSFPKSEAMLNVTDLKYYCNACKKSCYNGAGYQNHLFVVHRINCRQTSTIKEGLDINDSDRYCRICDKTLSNNFSLRRHEQAFHPAQQSTTTISRIQPDVNDHSNYCHICQRNYSSIASYRQHLQVAHEVALEPLKTGKASTSSLPNPDDSNFYCSVCKKSMKTRKSYRRHCNRVHQMFFSRCKTPKALDADIDINSPINYCEQ